MSQTNHNARSHLLRELAVPVVMLTSVLVYWSDAYHLSAEAVAFPLALTVVLVALLTSIIARVVWSYKPSCSETLDDPARSVGGQRPTLESTRKRWAIIVLAALMVLVWEYIGAAVAILLYVASLLLILDERRISWVIALPLVIAIGLTYLFKVILYLRLPEAAWLPGDWL